MRRRQALGLRQGEALGLKWGRCGSAQGNSPGAAWSATTEVRTRLQPELWSESGLLPAEEADPTRYRRHEIPRRPPHHRPPGRAGQAADATREAQERERANAAQLWQDGGWVFATPTGRPVNPNTDYHEWKQLLRDARLRDGRLHDARHTAATVLLILGVPERAVMGLMGWSSASMAKRYQHITDPVLKDVAERVDGLIWKPAHPPGEPDPTEPDDDQGDDGTAGVLVIA